LQHAFPLDVLMVPSSALAIAADGEHLSCDVFSLGETIHFGSLKFIADHLGGLSLSPMWDGLGATIMVSTHSETPSPLRSMIGYSVEECHMTSDEEGRIDLPSPRKHGTGASSAPTTTISWPETTPPTQAMTTILPWQSAPHHVPPFEEERILIVDYAPIQA
jgi:hypothetical protein